jgi:hypothetical protein
MKHYVTTLQQHTSIPGDVVPPGGRGWELHLVTAHHGAGLWVFVWSRDERPCSSCCGGPGCDPRTGCHTPWPHCEECKGTGWVPA